MSPTRLRTVALLARRPGLLVLEHALLGNPALEVAAVITHGRLPQAEGGGTRPEVEEFRRLCARADVPLLTADYPEAKDMEGLLPSGDLDLLVSLSWRYLVPLHVLKRFARGCINVHRGALPAYAGGLPVQRALEAGEKRVAITAHEMLEEVDAGETIAEVWMEVETLRRPEDAAVIAEQVKSSMEPLYAPLVCLAIQSRLLDPRS